MIDLDKNTIYIAMLNQPILQGKTITLGDNRLSQGRVWVARRANEATAGYGMPEGAILVLKTGDDANISADAIRRSGAVVIDQNDIHSHVARLCAEHNVPCIVNASGITNQVKRNDYLQVNTREGTVQKFNPGFLGKGSNFNRRIRYGNKNDEKVEKLAKRSFLQNTSEILTRPFKKEPSTTSFGHDTTLETQHDDRVANQPEPDISSTASPSSAPADHPEPKINNSEHPNIFKNSSNVLNAIEAEKHGQDMTNNITNNE